MCFGKKKQGDRSSALGTHEENPKASDRSLRPAGTLFFRKIRKKSLSKSFLSLQISFIPVKNPLGFACNAFRCQQRVFLRFWDVARLDAV